MLQTAFHRKKEAGYIIIAAVLILALLTIICVSALNMSTTEIKIATNELLYEKAFYAAEAGLQHSIELLRNQYINRYRAILSSGGTPPNWSFALQGAVDSDDDGVGDFAGSVMLLNRNLDNINIQVRVWNNGDGGGPTTDTDNLIYVRSEAAGLRRASCRVEMLLEGTIRGVAISDYSAQEGGGPGKNFVSSDAGTMADFTPTGLNIQ